MPIFLLLASLPLSLFLIYKGSDLLTDALEPIAQKLRTSNIAVGIMIVSVVVSLPEILVAGDAARRGYDDISLGVAFGSVIANIGLMTGISALIKPLHVSRMMILRDGVISLILPILIYGIAQKGVITRENGMLLFLLFIPYVINLILQEKQATVSERKKEKIEITEELSLIHIGVGSIKPGFLSCLIGIFFLLYGSYFFTDQLILLTQLLSLDQLFVGLTLGAIVPSLPNIIAAIRATQKGMTEVAVSETIGANVFTLLVTVGVTAMIAPITIRHSWLSIDLPILFCMSLLLVFFMISGHQISKKEGACLFFSYISILTGQIIWLS